METVALALLLVSVTVCCALVVFTIWLLKFTTDGDGVMIGGCAMPVPVTANVCVGYEQAAQLTPAT